MNKLASIVATTLLATAAYAQHSTHCTSLTALTLPNTKILTADPISPSDAAKLPPDLDETVKSLPPFCRVTAQLTPTSDSDIRIELWLPERWNGLFRGQGNGGFAGTIDRPGMSRNVAQGYATAATDTGHIGSTTAVDATWALHHPEKIADFGYRGIHEMTVTAQAILRSFYGTPAKHSFFAACSDGGREALMEAQRFPADYDGIIAGAPAYNWTALLTNAISNAQSLALTPASYIPPTKLQAISAAVLAACDAKDGLKDGILNDPRTCHVPSEALLCKQGDADTCLTEPQFKTLQALYAGFHSADGALIFPGFLPGSEVGDGGWTPWITGFTPGQSLLFAFGQQYFSNMVYSDPTWTIHSVNLDEAYAKANQETSASLNATNPNLSPFFTRGGKLILYHGWNDPAISALATVHYYEKMTVATPNASASSRLYMVPGMQHCDGGPGATSFGQFGEHASQGADDPQHNISLSLELWVEKGIAPDVITASHDEGTPTTPKITMTRPLCPYPKFAKYNGTGDPNTAASFTCTLSK